MNGIGRLYVFYIILLSAQIKSVTSSCVMPSAWLGSWYQRGMSSLLEITIDHIQTKGRCSDILPTQHYYLFTDRVNRCTRCLLFIERHINLLQYRESECGDADDLSSAISCPNMIAPDAPLYTLHRHNSKPQLCPIQPPYLLTNYIKHDSICRQTSSSSYIGECANDYQFRLHLSSCSSFQQSLDLELVCVGTWIEGFHTYFVARILSQTHSTTNNQYACFHFHTKQNDASSSTLSLSMATDDSCRDLNSKHMATIMNLSLLNQQKTNELNLPCSFPVELQSNEWYSLNRTIKLNINNNELELIDIEQNQNLKRIHCLRKINSLNYRIKTFRNCHIHEECLTIHQPVNNVLQLIINDCRNRKHNKTFTFIRKVKSSFCPKSIGYLVFESNFNYNEQYNFKSNIYQMSIGCHKQEKLMIFQREKSNEYNSLIQADSCLASWESNDHLTIFLISQSIYSNASYCLSFERIADTFLIRNKTNDCSYDTYDDEDDTSISIYSAKFITQCSKSERLLFKYILLPLTIFLSLINSY